MSDDKKKNEDQYILSFDPGGTSGMCLIRYNEKEVALRLLAQISDGHMGYYDNLVGMPGGYGTPITLVSEKWVEHGVKGADRTPLVIEGIQYAFWPDQVVYQTPSQKHDISDDVLKELGVWTEGKPHQMDALRHALVYLRNQMHMPTLEMLANGEPMPQDGDGDGNPQQAEGGADDGEGGEGGEGTGSLAAYLIELREGIEDDDDPDALVQKVKEVYERERDLDGAFAGYQADPGAERKTMIDEDF